MVRPEAIQLVDAGTAALTGIVDSITFTGNRQRVSIGGATTQALIVDAPNTIDVKVGERVGLAVPRDAVRLLPPEE